MTDTWQRWLESLRHTEVKTVEDAVEQLMYESIEYGGDMGPNGNTCNGIDEGDVLTSGFIDEWVRRFADITGLGHCHMRIVEDGCECDKCHWKMESPPRNYCPSCGRMILRW